MKITSEFRTVVKGLITYQGKILIGKKEEDDQHPIGGEWHLLGGHLEKGEDLEEAMTREVEEETSLEVHIHQIIDIMSFSWNGGEKDSIQILYHCEADSRDAEALSDLEEVKWVKPENIYSELNSKEEKRLEERKRQSKFIEKMKKASLF